MSMHAFLILHCSVHSRCPGHRQLMPYIYSLLEAWVCVPHTEACLPLNQLCRQLRAAKLHIRENRDPSGYIMRGVMHHGQEHATAWLHSMPLPAMGHSLHLLKQLIVVNCAISTAAHGPWIHHLHRHNCTHNRIRISISVHCNVAPLNTVSMSTCSVVEGCASSVLAMENADLSDRGAC